MQRFSHHVLALSILSIWSSASWADDQAVQVTTLAPIKVSAQAASEQVPVLATLQREQLQQSAATLGEVLQGQPGVVASNFGAGSSRPVIRGQEGARVKVTENASETMDVSSLSPDHVITVDPQLSED